MFGFYYNILMGLSDYVPSLSATIEYTFEMHPCVKTLFLELMCKMVDFFYIKAPIMFFIYCQLKIKAEMAVWWCKCTKKDHDKKRKQADVAPFAAGVNIMVELD